MSEEKELRIDVDVLAASYGIAVETIYQVLVTGNTRTIIIKHDTPSK